jgi:uroporphyrinogen decarboxylase
LSFLHQKKTPSLLFSKSSVSRLEHIKKLELNAISVDWTCSLKSHLEILPKNMAIQGNLDPFLTTLDFGFIKEELEKSLKQVQGCPGYIFNLGHGVFPETKLETLQKIIECVKAKQLSFQLSI